MFFEKPNVRYVDMCIYIDDHIYTEDYDEELVYQYLYHIIMMITIQRDYFKGTQLIDDFSLYAASIYYMRLTDERQFGEEPTLLPIKSILNYVRKTLFSVRRDFKKKYVAEEEIASSELFNLDFDAFEVYVNKKIDPIGRIDFDGCLSNVQATIKNCLANIPYKCDTTMWTNIYISCMLSFLNSITLKNKDVQRIQNFKRPESLSDKLLNQLYLDERYNTTILYHLPDSMYNYITVLTTRIRHALSKDLGQAVHTPLPSCINIKNLLVSNISEE